MLDAALMRPGRFDQAVYVPPPDEHSRCEILKIHTKHMPLSPDVDLMDIASRVSYYEETKKKAYMPLKTLFLFRQTIILVQIYKIFVVSLRWKP